MATEQDPVTAITTRLLTHAATTILATRRIYDSHDPRQPQDAFNAQRQRPPPTTTTTTGVVDDGKSFPGLIPLLQQLLSCLIIGIAMLGISALAYGMFYFLIMPSPCTQQPLYFDYTGTATIPAYYQLDSISKELVAVQHRHHHSKKRKGNQQLPWAAVDLFAVGTSWVAHRPDVLPSISARGLGFSQQQQQLRLFKAGNFYFIELYLQLPETVRNREASIFGVAVELYDTNHTRLATSMRSTRLPHESTWLGVIRKLVWLVPILLGAVDESRSVMVPSFRYYRESADYPLQHVFVKLVMPSSEMPPVEVTSGEIRIGQELNHFQRLLKEWYYTCYMVGTCVLFVIQFVAFFCWRYLIHLQQRIKEKHQLEEEFDVRSNLSFSSWEDLNAAPHVGRDGMDENVPPHPQHEASSQAADEHGVQEEAWDDGDRAAQNTSDSAEIPFEHGDNDEIDWGTVSQISFASALSQVSSHNYDETAGNATVIVCDSHEPHSDNVTPVVFPKENGGASLHRDCKRESNDARLQREEGDKLQPPSRQSEAIIEEELQQMASGTHEHLPIHNHPIPVNESLISLDPQQSRASGLYSTASEKDKATLNSSPLADINKKTSSDRENTLSNRRHAASSIESSGMDHCADQRALDMIRNLIQPFVHSDSCEQS